MLTPKMISVLQQEHSLPTPQLTESSYTICNFSTQQDLFQHSRLRTRKHILYTSPDPSVHMPSFYQSHFQHIGPTYPHNLSSFSSHTCSKPISDLELTKEGLMSPQKYQQYEKSNHYLFSKTYQSYRNVVDENSLDRSHDMKLF